MGGTSCLRDQNLRRRAISARENGRRARLRRHARAAGSAPSYYLAGQLSNPGRSYHCLCGSAAASALCGSRSGRVPYALRTPNTLQRRRRGFAPRATLPRTRGLSGGAHPRSVAANTKQRAVHPARGAKADCEIHRHLCAPAHAPLPRTRCLSGGAHLRSGAANTGQRAIDARLGVDGRLRSGYALDPARGGGLAAMDLSLRPATRLGGRGDR